MRAFTQNELEYLKERDPISLSRIPMILPMLDQGNHRYDDEEKVYGCRDYYALMESVKDRIPNPEEKDSLTLVLTNSLFRKIGVASRTYDKEHPLCLSDVAKIAILSGTVEITFIFNHPNISYQPKKKLLFSSVPKMQEEDAIFINLYSQLDFGQRMGNCLSINLKEHSDFTDRNYIFSDILNNRDVLSRSKKLAEKSLDIEKKRNVQEFHPELSYDFTANGTFPKLSEDSLDQWNFYVSKDQIEPIGFDEWKKSLSDFRIEDFVDPQKKDIISKEIFTKRKNAPDVDYSNMKEILTNHPPYDPKQDIILYTVDNPEE